MEKYSAWPLGIRTVFNVQLFPQAEKNVIILEAISTPD